MKGRNANWNSYVYVIQPFCTDTLESQNYWQAEVDFVFNLFYSKRWVWVIRKYDELKQQQFMSCRFVYKVCSSDKPA